jgi:transcriptional regulator with XRE-family HTH domain
MTMRFAEKLYKQMLLKGLNQQKLAQLSSVSDSEVSRILNGKSNPSLEYAFRLARALGLSLDYLADDELEDSHRAGSDERSNTNDEILELSRELGARQSRRILETANDLGYQVAIRRLLGSEAKPLIEVGVGDSPRSVEHLAASSVTTRAANSA